MDNLLNFYALVSQLTYNKNSYFLWDLFLKIICFYIYIRLDIYPTCICQDLTILDQSKGYFVEKCEVKI